MKIKVNEKLKGVNDEFLLDREGRELTLKETIIQSLLSPVQEDRQEDKWNKYEIYKKIKNTESDVDLKTEEIAIIKKSIGKFQPPLILGQCFEIIEDGNS